jgi:2-succinyl-6-hydroxy-2,4-cyclohexadiene-1-carboxylate synthase
MSERRLVFLHGFTQTHHHWHACALSIARTVGDEPELVFVDLPGHGLSGGDRLTLEQAAPQLVTLAGAGTYIGYSMGARHALAAACECPPEIERLVLVGGTAGLADASQRGVRVAEDESKARRVEQIGVEAFVDEWLAQPMFAGFVVTDTDRRHRYRNTAEGLAASLRLAGTGAQEPLWDSLGSIDVPVLVIAGERDTKFTEIGRRMARMILNATFVTIPNAGHAAHAEQPDVTATLITDWLST